MIALHSGTIHVLVVLVILNVPARVTPTEGTTCQHSIHCPCGNTSKNVTFCTQEERKDDLCNILSKCKTCQDGVDRCLECPEGFEGSHCTKGTRRTMLYRQKRHLPPHPYDSMRPRRQIPNQTNTSPVERERARSLTFCQDPGVDPNGSRAPNSSPSPRGFPQGTHLQYSCNRDYDLDGERSLFCLTSGEWSSGRPSCNSQSQSQSLQLGQDTTIIFCREPGVDPNGNRNPRLPPNRRGFPQGTRLDYSCYQGYDLEGESSIFCYASGEWSSDIPRCQFRAWERISERSCNKPRPILNGKVEIVNQRGRPLSPDPNERYVQGSRSQYSCDSGYSLNGTSSLICEPSGHWSAHPPTCRINCGQPQMGGDRREQQDSDSKTAVGEWPWVVAIAVQENDITRIICGGALLDNQMVITAAHCLMGAKQFTLYFGKYHLNNQLDDNYVQVRTSDRFIINPDFKVETLDSDIALIKFSPKITFSDRIQALCLPTRQSTARNILTGSTGYVTGWGYTEGQQPPPEMKMVNLPVVSPNVCFESFSDILPNVGDILTQNMFCAGLPDVRPSTCIGDGGSPFVFFDERTERYILEGLVSFSVAGECGISGGYTIFTNINRFLSWISQNM